jgi:RNA polymerase sigma factor (TIGR02999 family)
MTGATPADFTRSLVEFAAAPEDRVAADRVFGVIHDELTRLAARRLRGHNLSWSATDLVHETYVRLVDRRAVTPGAEHSFVAVATKAMRQVLVDHARAKAAEKRGGGRERVTLSGLTGDEEMIDADVLDLDRLLRELEALDKRAAWIVQLRFFIGLSMQEIADHLGVTRRTAHNDWRMARAWLLSRLNENVAP